jgi:hypothetical protein
VRARPQVQAGLAIGKFVKGAVRRGGAEDMFGAAARRCGEKVAPPLSSDCERREQSILVPQVGLLRSLALQ